MVQQMDTTWDLSPDFARVAGFLSTERMALVALGLDRRARNIPDLARAFQATAQHDEDAHHDR